MYVLVSAPYMGAIFSKGLTRTFPTAVAGTARINNEKIISHTYEMLICIGYVWLTECTHQINEICSSSQLTG